MTDFDKIDTSTLTPKQLEIYNVVKITYDNDFVKDYDFETNKIYYTKDFYIVMNKLLSLGKSPVQVYNFLGFDTKILGEDRAYAAAKRAKEFALKPNYGLNIGDYDGSVPRDKMGKLTYEEENAYIRARNLYLEKAHEVKKKILSQLAEKGIYYKAKN